MLSPSPDSSGNLPVLENKALAVAFLNRELGVYSGKQLLKKIFKKLYSIKKPNQSTGLFFLAIL
jgi:heme oxygenase